MKCGVPVRAYIPVLCYRSGDSEALHTLDLSWNHLRGKGATALAAGLKVSLHLMDGVLVAQLKQDALFLVIVRYCTLYK